MMQAMPAPQTVGCANAGLISTEPLKPLFDMGHLCATPSALEALERNEQAPATFLFRHVTGDWLDMSINDITTNENAAREGGRVFSSYRLKDGSKLWIITEADRSVTTLLLPSEY